MKKIIKTIAKNTAFSTRLWLPRRILLAGPKGNFNLVRMGFGQKVMCQVKVSLKSPLPTLEYFDYDQYTDHWIENIATVCSSILGMSPEDCQTTAKVMLRKYTVDVYFKDALLNHFEERLTEQELTQAGII